MDHWSNLAESCRAEWSARVLWHYFPGFALRTNSAFLSKNFTELIWIDDIHEVSLLSYDLQFCLFFIFGLINFIAVAWWSYFFPVHLDFRQWKAVEAMVWQGCSRTGGDTWWLWCVSGHIPTAPFNSLLVPRPHITTSQELHCWCSRPHFCRRNRTQHGKCVARKYTTNTIGGSFVNGIRPHKQHRGSCQKALFR